MSLLSHFYIRSHLSSYCLLINLIEIQRLCRQACTYHHSLHSAQALLRMRRPVFLVLSVPVVPPNLLSLRGESEFTICFISASGNAVTSFSHGLELPR